MNKMKMQLTYKHQQNTGNVVERNDYFDSATLTNSMMALFLLIENVTFVSYKT